MWPLLPPARSLLRAQDSTNLFSRPVLSKMRPGPYSVPIQACRDSFRCTRQGNASSWAKSRLSSVSGQQHRLISACNRSLWSMHFVQARLTMLTSLRASLRRVCSSSLSLLSPGAQQHCAL